MGGAPMEIAATIDRLNHHSPVISVVPIPRNRILPDPTALRSRPAKVGQNKRTERTLIAVTPRCWEIAGETHDK